MKIISKTELVEWINISISDLHTDSNNQVKIINGTYKVTSDKVENQLMTYMRYYDYDINVNDNELRDIVDKELNNYQRYNNHNHQDKKECGLCGKEYVGYGNTSYQAKAKGLICNECNNTTELQFRLGMLEQHNYKNKK